MIPRQNVRTRWADAGSYPNIGGNGYCRDAGMALSFSKPSFFNRKDGVAGVRSKGVNMETIKTTGTEKDNVVEINKDSSTKEELSSKKVAEFPSMFGSSRTMPSPDWAQYMASHAAAVTSTRRASRGSF